MRIPKHIGIIPDGNRRWAVQHGLQKQEGYSYGLAPGLALFRQAAAYGIEEISYSALRWKTANGPKRSSKRFKRHA